MSDANAYMNAYVDNAVGLIHEYIGGILQLKTQLKVCESIIEAKNVEIEKLSKFKNEETEQILLTKESELNDLQNQLTDLKNQLISHGNLGTENVELHRQCSDLQHRCNDLQNENNALAQKVSHMDSLLKQMSEMKQDIITRNNMIADLEQKLARQTETKPEVVGPVVINKNRKVSYLKSSTQKENDDF